jgi:hypothetical protein
VKTRLCFRKKSRNPASDTRKKVETQLRIQKNSRNSAVDARTLSGKSALDISEKENKITVGHAGNKGSPFSDTKKERKLS